MKSLIKRISIANKEWIEIESINEARINFGIVCINEKFLYIFGGVDPKSKLMNSIERYNIDMNVWNIMRFKLPDPISNCIGACLSTNIICIFGGIRRISGNESQSTNNEKQYEASNQLLILNTDKQSVEVREFCTFKKKIQSVQINETGHAFCIYINKNNELPLVNEIDLNRIYHQYSLYARSFAKTKISKIGKVDFDFVEEENSKHVEIAEMFHSAVELKELSH